MKRKRINLAHPAKDPNYIIGIIKPKYIMHTKAHRIAYNSETIKNWQENSTCHCKLQFSNDFPATNCPDRNLYLHLMYWNKTNKTILCIPHHLHCVRTWI